MTCFCITSEESCDSCEAIINDFREPDFIPNRLYYHTDVTDKIILGKVQGQRTFVTYSGKTFPIATSLIKKENNRVYVHTNIFEDILRKEFENEELFTKEDLIQEVRELKDQVKELLNKIETMNIE